MTTKTSPREVLEEAGLTVYADEEVLENAPIGEIEEVKLFHIGKYVSCKELEEEYEKRGLEPANLNSIIPHLSEKNYIATQWKDESGKYCYATFGQWGDERRVDVNRHDGVWADGWWFAGRRKSLELDTQSSSEPLSLELSVLQELRKEIEEMKFPEIDYTDSENRYAEMPKFESGRNKALSDVLALIDKKICL